MKSAIIIPTYNEAENIKSLVNKILKLKTSSIIIIVDDNSPDGTGHIADQLANKSKNVFVVHRTKKLGLGTAYIAGIKKALLQKADVVITMDADLSHDPSVIPQMLSYIKKYDVVIGSRHTLKGKINGFDWFRHSLSGGAQIVSRYLLGIPVADATSGYRAYRMGIIDGIDLPSIKSQGYSFLIEALYRVCREGYTVKEVPIHFNAREKGKSKLSQAEIYKAFITSARLLKQRLVN